MYPMTREELKEFSENLLTVYYGGELKVQPLDVYDFIARFLGYKVHYLSFQKHGIHIDGVSVCSPYLLKVQTYYYSLGIQLNGNEIYLDASLLDRKNGNRRNFTMVHEAAHLIFDAFPREEGRLSECQASQFASYLLMPDLLMNSLVKEPIECCKINNDYLVLGKSKYILKELSRTLHVSQSALLLRLEELHLLSFQPLGERGYSLVA